MGSSKKYYWLKLKDDFFDNKQIKFLRKLPSGSDLVIVYLKMQLKALKTEGLLAYDKIMPSCEEELALILDEDVNLISMTIAALVKVGAIEQMDNGSLYMLAMQDLIGKEGESAERVRRFREKQSQLSLQCNAEVTNCNTEKDIELNKEKDIINSIPSEPFPKYSEEPITKKSKTEEKKSFKRTDYVECVSLISSCQNTLKSKGRSIDPTQYPIPVLNKRLKKWFEIYGVEDTKKGIKNSISHSWLVNNGYKLSVLFSDTIFPQCVSLTSNTNAIEIKKGQTAFVDKERSYTNDEGGF